MVFTFQTAHHVRISTLFVLWLTAAVGIGILIDAIGDGFGFSFLRHVDDDFFLLENEKFFSPVAAIVGIEKAYVLLYTAQIEKQKLWFFSQQQNCSRL